jgi:hypothetical protein
MMDWLNRFDSFKQRSFYAYLSILLLSLCSLLIPVLNHFYYRSYAYDYAAYNFAFHDFAHFRVSPNPVYIAPFPITFLQDHVSFTLPILSPFYWLFRPLFGTYSLIVIQWLFTLVGGIYTYRFIKEMFKDGLYGILAVVVYYLICFRFTSFQTDVNLAIIGAGLIPLWIYCLTHKKWWGTILVTLFLLQNREDFALWLLFLSFFILIKLRKDGEIVKLSSLVAVISVGYFLFTFYCLIPLLEDENKKFYLFNYGALGDGPLQAIKFIFSHPLEAFKLLFVNHSGNEYYDGVKVEFYLVTLASGGLLLFYRPLFFIPFIPLVTKKMWNDDPVRWSIESYYGIEFAALIPILIFWIISDAGHKFKKGLAIGMVVLTAGVAFYKFNCGNHKIQYADCTKVNFLTGAFYQSEHDLKQVRKYINTLPGDAKISAASTILPHLAYRDYPYFFPRVDDAQYILLFKTGNHYPLSDDEFKAKLNDLMKNNTYSIELEAGDFIVFRKN